MPRYTYGSFWCRTGIAWFVYVMFVASICALHGHPVIAHFVISRSIPIHSQYLCSLCS